MNPDQDRPSPTLSVIVPALDEAHLIGATLDALARMPGDFEVLVADGGSRDATTEIARSRGAVVVVAGRGRGTQMHAGAVAARGDVLWFLHADTIPPHDAARRIDQALADPAVVGGHFAILFGGPCRAARFLTWLYPKLARLGLAYGDSAFFVRRDAYERIGGFRPYPIFEDLDLLRRLRRLGPFVRVPATVVTSPRMFEGRSFAPVFARWTVLQVFYWLGASPVRMGRWYARMRASRRHRPPDRPRPDVEGECRQGEGDDVR